MTEMTEAEAIDLAQKSLGKLKKALTALYNINTEAGRLEAANAAYGMLGRSMVLHSDATKELYTHKPDEAGGIVAQAGGR